MKAYLKQTLSPLRYGQSQISGTQILLLFHWFHSCCLGHPVFEFPGSRARSQSGPGHFPQPLGHKLQPTPGGGKHRGCSYCGIYLDLWVCPEKRRRHYHPEQRGRQRRGQKVVQSQALNTTCVTVSTTHSDMGRKESNHKQCHPTAELQWHWNVLYETLTFFLSFPASHLPQPTGNIFCPVFFHSVA